MGQSTDAILAYGVDLGEEIPAWLWEFAGVQRTEETDEDLEELKDDVERSKYIESTSSIASFSHLFRERAMAMVSAVWAARRRQKTLYWYDIGSVLSSVGL